MRGSIKLLTRTGLDWTHKYPAIAKAVAALDARQAYLDGELCGVGSDGITSFNIVQLASDSGTAAALVFFLFDVLYLDGEDFRPRPLIERKERLRMLLANAAPSLHYSDHVVGQGPAFYEKACAMSVEGIVSKRTDAAYAPGNRGLWLKVKCLHRKEFVVIGWTDPEGRRPYVGALLLAYYDPNGPLVAPSTCQVGLAGCRRLAVGIGGLLPIHATDFGPDPEFLGPGSSMLCGSDVIAAEVEEVIDLIVG
jgi:bifunctional non-homologous end joining protein LigD